MIYLSKALGDRLVQNTEVKKKCSKKSSTPFLLFMIGYKIKSFFFKCVPLRIGTPFFTKLSSKLTVKLVADISKSSVKTQNFMVISAVRSLVIFESKKKLVYAFLLARATNQ